MRKFKLPIQLDNIDCVSKCWIYNRLAIIKTSPYYRDWIASHYNLSVTKGFRFDLENVTPSYHEEILLRKPGNLFQLTRENIVGKLKGYLCDGYYINLMLKPDPDMDYMHEILIYGFDDDTQYFSAVGIDNRIFQSIPASYTYIEEGIERVKEALLKSEERGLELSLAFQYPMTLFKLNPNFRPDNCVFEAYQKVKRELNGELHDLYLATGLGEYQLHLYEGGYTGICCLDVYRKMLEMEIRDERFEDWFPGITINTKALVEHRQMMKQTLEYIIDKWELAVTDAARSSAKAYGECCEVAITWLGLCLKYEITKDKKLLERIVARIPEMYEKERACLESFLKEGFDLEKLNRYYI